MKTNDPYTFLNRNRLKTPQTIISNQIIANLCIIDWVELRNCQRLKKEIDGVSN